MNIDYPKNVLFVDDEPNIIKSLRRGLMMEEYEKFFALSGEEALAIMEDKEISVIVTDMKMPGMNGLELLKIAREKYPDTVRIVLSGYTHLPQVLVTINKGEIFRFIAKPWKMDSEFKKVIWDAIEYYGSIYENKKLKDELTRRNKLYQNLIKSNDKKIENLKNQLEFVKRVSSNFYDFMDSVDNKLKNGEISEKDYWKNIGYFKDINYTVIRSIPAEEKVFSIKKLVDDVTDNINMGNDSDINIEYNTDENSYKGYYGFYLNIISVFIKCLMNVDIEALRMAIIKDQFQNYIAVVASVESDFEIDNSCIERLEEVLKEMLDINIRLSVKDGKYSLLIQLSQGG